MCEAACRIDVAAYDRLVIRACLAARECGRISRIDAASIDYRYIRCNISMLTHYITFKPILSS